MHYLDYSVPGLDSSLLCIIPFPVQIISQRFVHIFCHLTRDLLKHFLSSFCKISLSLTEHGLSIGAPDSQMACISVAQRLSHIAYPENILEAI